MKELNEDYSDCHEETDSECCSCDTCSCDCGSCCESSLDSKCSSCNGSPRQRVAVDLKCAEDLDIIKSFITDIAGLIRQTRNGSLSEDVKTPPDNQHESEESPKHAEEAHERVHDITTLSPQSNHGALEREIAQIEEIINHTEMNLKNNYAGNISLPINGSLYSFLPSPVGSPCSYGASTVMASEMYDCCTNEHTVMDEHSYTNTPIAGERAIWHSGFEMPMHATHWDNDDDDQEVDLNTLHSRMVALDLHSYMYLVETVLDERVRSEIAQKS